MVQSQRNDDGAPLNVVGRVFDSRWMMAIAVLAVLVAIAWALSERGPKSTEDAAAPAPIEMATVELLGVPSGAEVLLDGQPIENTRFGVTPNTRHALEVKAADGRTWRQVFVANGSLSLVVELRTHFVEVDVSPKDRAQD